MKRVSLLLLISLVLSSIQQISFAEYWNLTSTEIMAPSSIVADESGDKLFMSFPSNSGLWDCRLGEFSNLNYELSDYGEYSKGSFYHLNTPGSYLLHVDKPLSSRDDILLYSEESDSWSLLEGISGIWFSKLYVDPESSTIFTLMYGDSIWISQDLMSTHETISFPSDHMLRSIFRVGTDFYCSYTYWLSDTLNTAVSVYNPETVSWEFENPVFKSSDFFYSRYTNVHNIVPLSNGDIFFSIYTNDDTAAQYNFICNSDWEITDWIDDEDINGKFFFQILEDWENPGTLYAKTSSTGIFYSMNNGRSWEYFTASGFPEGNISINILYQQPESGDLYVSTAENGVLKSTNSGETWERIDIPDMIGPGDLSIQNEYVGIYNKKSKWCLYGNDQWNTIQITDANYAATCLIELYYMNGDTLFGMARLFEEIPSDGFLNLAMSTDRGLSWTYSPIDMGVLNITAHRLENGIRLLSYNEYTDPIYSYTIDFGQTWIPLDSPTPKIAQSDDYFFSVITGSYCDSLIVRKNVQGGEWENMALTGDGLNQFILLPYSDESLLILAAIDPFMDGGRCYWYSDGQWVQKGSTEYPSYPDLIFEHNNQAVALFASNESESIKISRDSCQTFEEFTLDIPFDIPPRFYSYELRYNSYDNTLWVRTDFGLLWCPIEELLDVEDHTIHLQPAEFDLFTAYPNPFNASTRICYNLTQPGNVKLDVYDITGRLVKTLQNTHQPAGIQSVFFDGSGLASGTYFIRLNTGAEIRNRRITLVK